MDPIDKKFYKIGEVAELTGLPVSTLRFWEQQFTIIKPRRNDRGTRFYTPDDVERIRMIHYLVKHRRSEEHTSELQSHRAISVCGLGF